jgi:hypothetical protein
MVDDSTGTVIWSITIPVIFEVSRCHYRYGNLVDYRTGNLSKCHDVISGMVTWLITVPVIIQSVTMALPVQ